MRLYLAGSDVAANHVALEGLENLALLVSYYYIMNGKGEQVINWAFDRGVPVFLDSGAFTAMTMKTEIRLREYIDFCHAQGAKFEVMASLDVIGDWQATWRNHVAMREAGIESIPCFHVNEPFEALQQMVQTNEHIAIGVAGNQRNRGAVMRFLIRCFQIIPSRVRVHGFALTSSLIMRSFPWTSVDSTTWLISRKFGEELIIRGAGFQSHYQKCQKTHGDSEGFERRLLPL